MKDMDKSKNGNYYKVLAELVIGLMGAYFLLQFLGLNNSLEINIESDNNDLFDKKLFANLTVTNATYDKDTGYVTVFIENTGNTKATDIFIEVLQYGTKEVEKIGIYDIYILSWYHYEGIRKKSFEWAIGIGWSYTDENNELIQKEKEIEFEVISK